MHNQNFRQNDERSNYLHNDRSYATQGDRNDRYGHDQGRWGRNINEGRWAGSGDNDSDRIYGDRGYGDRGYGDRGYGDRNMSNDRSLGWNQAGYGNQMHGGDRYGSDRMIERHDVDDNWVRGSGQRNDFGGNQGYQRNDFGGNQGYQDHGNQGYPGSQSLHGGQYNQGNVRDRGLDRGFEGGRSSYGEGTVGGRHLGEHNQGGSFGNNQGMHGGFGGQPQREFVGKGPKGYARSDERIREEICERLSEGYLDASDIDVTVRNGEVTLGGTVLDRRTKRLVEEIVEAASGVKDIENKLKVKGSAGTKSDEGTDTQNTSGTTGQTAAHGAAGRNGDSGLANKTESATRRTNANS